jgi:hypothetical protein
MPKGPLDTTTVKIAVFARRELHQLVTDLYTDGVKIAANEDIIGALVLAARRESMDTVKGYVEAYIAREAAIKATLAPSVEDLPEDE